MKSTETSLLHLLRALLLGLCALLALPRDALAAGTLTIQNKEPQENDGKWKLNFTIDYGATPHLQHIPMLFSFTPTALYERSLTDQSGEKPVLTRIPLVNQQGINESMDVGFTDGSGKVFKITKFDFVIRRDRGFEAGEYTLKVTRASDGVQVGATQNLKLKGDNPIVDRRAIVFAGGKKDKDKEKKAEGDGEKKADDAGEKKPEEKPMEKVGEGADPAAAGEPPPGDPSEGAGPPPVPPKQGGCGCRIEDQGVSGSAAALPLFVAGAAAARRRRRRRAAARG